MRTGSLGVPLVCSFPHLTHFLFLKVFFVLILLDKVEIIKNILYVFIIFQKFPICRKKVGVIHESGSSCSSRLLLVMIHITCKPLNGSIFFFFFANCNNKIYFGNSFII